ncbi:MAG: AAA family ATPase [Sphingobium sp.]
MNQETSGKRKGSLLERAADIYDFGAALRGRAAPALDVPADLGDPLPPAAPAIAAPVGDAAPAAAPQTRAPDWTGRPHAIDRDTLAEAGYIRPDGQATALSEEFRLLKRDLLLQLRDHPLGNRILLCSAHSGEGKTFCAINLALSLAAEQDREILLVDADFGKPGIPQALGIASGDAPWPGFMDALANPSIAVEDIVLRTDIPSLSILPAGARSNNDTEYLASARTETLLRRLTEGRPERIILFDSPPLLAASPAAVLASHVAIALLIVRADKTTESALRDAAGMLKGGAQVQMLLNGVTYSSSGRRFGTYYSKGDTQS